MENYQIGLSSKKELMRDWLMALANLLLKHTIKYLKKIFGHYLIYLIF